MRRRTTLLALMAFAVGAGITVWTLGARAPAPRWKDGTATPPAAPSTSHTALTGRLDEGTPERVEESPSSIDPSIVSGRVVDPQGLPLAGIPVYVGLATPKGYVLSDQRFLWLAGPDADGGRAPAWRYGAYGVTNDAGEFRVDAALTRHLSSDDGRVRVVPSHPAWMEPRVVTGEEGGEIHAEPAASLAVRVVDEQGVALPEFRAVVREEGRGTAHLVAATKGGFVVQWRRRDGVPDEIRASIAIWARGRAIERREVTLPADRLADSVTLALGPVRQDGRLVLRRPATETSAVGAVALVLALEERPQDELLRVGMTPIDPSRRDGYIADLPPGRFRVRAYVTEPPRERWIVDETIEIPADTATERTWASADPARR